MAAPIRRSRGMASYGQQDDGSSQQPVYAGAPQEAPADATQQPEYAPQGAAPSGIDSGVPTPRYAAPPSAPYGQPGAQLPDTSTGDINQMWRGNRTYDLNQGQAIDSGIVAQQDHEADLENQYRTGMNASYEDLKNQPGYSPDQQSQIIRDKQFNSLIAPDSAYDKLNPTDEQKAGMMGNSDYLNPALQRQVNANSANMQRGAVQSAKQGIGDTLDQEGQTFNDINSDPNLGLSKDFYTNTSGALNAGNAAVRGTIDSGVLNQDKDAAQRSRITDKDVQDFQTKAANTVRSQAGANEDRLRMDAAAAGNAGPLAVAAGRARIQNNAEVGAADAMTNARVAGRGMQTQREMDLESQRENAAQGYAGLASSNEQALAARGLGQANTNEQARLDAERDIANRRTSAATTLGSQGLQGNEFAGSLATGVETGIGGQEANTEQNITNTGQAAEQNQANRAANLYNTGVSNTKYGIDSKYGQGMGVNTQLSNANTNVANADLAGKGEYRGWTTGQTNTNQQAGQQSTSQRIANYGTQAGATNQATGGLSNWEVGNQGNTPFAKTLKTVGVLSGVAANAKNARP